jgi:hypothetical protein
MALFLFRQRYFPALWCCRPFFRRHISHSESFQVVASHHRFKSRISFSSILDYFCLRVPTMPVSDHYVLMYTITSKSVRQLDAFLLLMWSARTWHLQHRLYFDPWPFSLFLLSILFRSYFVYLGTVLVLYVVIIIFYCIICINILSLKIRSTTSFWGEVKPSVPCRRFTARKRTLRAWKKMLRRQNSAAMFLTHVSPASLIDGSAL